MLWEDVRHAVHQESLAEIRCREELHVHSGLADEIIGNGVVEIDGHRHSPVLRGHFDSGLEAVVRIVQDHGNGVVGFVNGPGLQHGIDVPLLGSVHQADTAARGDTDSAEDNLDGRGLLVTEHSSVVVAVNEEVDAGVLEILEVVDFEALCRQPRCQGRKQNCKQCEFSFHLKNLWRVIDK